MHNHTHDIFITGASGYMGTRLIRALHKKGHYRVKALVRKGSEKKLPNGCELVIGNALQADTYSHHIEKRSVFIHLVGVAHPSPSKKNAFETIDLVSVQEAIKAAKEAGVSHFIYLSVSQFPSGVMKDYQQIRAKGEELLLKNHIRSSFVRPWYVLGPGHWWPLLLTPFYAVAKLSPALKEKAEKQGLVRIHHMINTLMYSIHHPPAVHDVYEIRDIRTHK